MRYKPPSNTKIACVGISVYLIIAGIAFAAVSDIPLFPKNSYHASLACGPGAYTLAQNLFFWFVFIPVVVMIPYVYVVYVIYDVYRNNLLPPRGKRRIFTTFFFRIVGVFCIMWIPFVAMIYFVSVYFVDSSKGHWVVFWAGTWAHLQAAVSAALTLTKPDILAATKSLLMIDRCVTRTTRESITEIMGDHKHPLESDTGERIASSRAPGARSNILSLLTGMPESIEFDDTLPRQMSDYMFEDEVDWKEGVDGSDTTLGSPEQASPALTAIPSSLHYANSIVELGLVDDQDRVIENEVTTGVCGGDSEDESHLPTVPSFLRLDELARDTDGGEDRNNDEDAEQGSSA